MTRIGRTRQTADAKWFNSPVTVTTGTLKAMEAQVPDFERRPFGLEHPHSPLTRLNENLDVVVRRPLEGDGDFVPVGVVSKGYTLVPHRQVIRVVGEALGQMGIDPATITAELTLTRYGERMALSAYFPNSFSFDPGDGHTLKLRLECYNSVDGSTRLRVILGWFRVICKNGMIIGITRIDMRRRHVGDIRLADTGNILSSGLEEAGRDKDHLQEWYRRPIVQDNLVKWVEGEVRRTWGFKAAARTYRIALTGCDADVIGPYKDTTPTTVPVIMRGEVPGTRGPAKNLYDVCQVLAWLAARRRDVQEQLEWKEQIPGLFKSLER